MDFANPDCVPVKDRYGVPMVPLKSDTLLLTTAAVWGFSFVFQRMGMDSVGPFTFMAMRFLLSCLTLLPLMIVLERRPRNRRDRRAPGGLKEAVVAGALAGSAMFLGEAFQQVGLLWTTAGKAGFITGLYVIFVPMLGLFARHRPAAGTWAGAVLAAVGMYFLSIPQSAQINTGDVLELVGAVFWAIHVLAIGRFALRVRAIRLVFFQVVVVTGLSFIAAFLFETIRMADVMNAAIPILYGGTMSGGIAYTLQILGQRGAPPAHAAVLFSMEAVFAALGGWLVLGESMTLRALFGAGLMLFGMLASQVWELRRAGAVQ